MDDFYFVYDYDKKKMTASRLYRRINSQFERYYTESQSWKPAPEQACINIGEDVFYDEITEEQALKIIANNALFL